MYHRTIQTRHKWVLSDGPNVLHRTRFYININVCLLRMCYISHLPPLSVYVFNNRVILLIYIGVLNQNVYVFEIFSFFLNISFLNNKAFFNQLFNLRQIMLSSRPYALMDTFLVLEAFSLVSQYVISSINGIKFRIHHTRIYMSRPMYHGVGTIHRGMSYFVVHTDFLWLIHRLLWCIQIFYG